MPRLPDEIREFMRTYGVLEDEVWPVPGGKAFAVKHKALERIAMELGIVFDLPTVLEANGPEKCAAIVVQGHRPNPQGGHMFNAWSIGEAAPANNKNQYPYAMAEKRAKDRVILKLLSCHGSLYSEDEAEDFKQPPAPAAAPAKKDESAKLYFDLVASVIEEGDDHDELKAWWGDAANVEQRAKMLDSSDSIQLRNRLIAKLEKLKFKVKESV